MIKTRVNRLRGVEGRNSSDQIAICAIKLHFVHFIHSQWKSKRMLATPCDTCVITTWRLGLGAPLAARKYIDLARAKSESPVNKFII